MNLKSKILSILILITIIVFTFYIKWQYSKNEKKISSSTNILNNKKRSISSVKDDNSVSLAILQTKKENEIYNKIKSDLLKYFDTYTVQKWDTIGKVSNTYWISNYEDLVLLNWLLWVEFKTRTRDKKTVVLWIGDKIYIPKPWKLDAIFSKLTFLEKVEKTLELNHKVNLEDTIDLLPLVQNLYPKTVQAVWVEKMLKGFIYAQKQEFDPSLPRIVDIQRQSTISCANLIRTLLAFSVNKKTQTEKEKLFFQKQWLDAWILPISLKEIWYVQTYNLMEYFVSGLVWTPSPISVDKEANYNKKVIEIWKHLEKEWIPWTILPLYFRYSGFTKVVASYNRGKEEKHYNTHQSILAWVDTISFVARNVWNFSRWNRKSFDKLDPKEMIISDYLTNFIQQRWDYWPPALSDWQKKIIQTNLLTFNSLINIKVNWKQVDLSKELFKTKEEMFKIKPDDKIDLYWPIMIDGLHMLNSPDGDKQRNMNSRTRFYFEFIIIWTFLPSELLEPWKGVLWIWTKNQDVIWDLEVKWVYAIKKWDTVETAIKDKVLRYEKDSFDKLDEKDSNYEFNYKTLLNYYYSQQIRALKISWYLQSESEINPWAFNINAPIPYFVPDNISEVFSNYVSKMREDVNIEDIDTFIMKNYIQVTTFPLDSYKNVINRIKNEIEVYSKYKDNWLVNIHLFLDFNELQQRKFLDLFLTKAQKSKKIVSKDFLNWKISEWIDMILSLKDIDKMIYDISKESYSPKVDLNSSDKFAIDLVVKLNQNNNILKNILNIESYTPEWSYWTRRFLKQILEYNSYLQQNFNFLWKRINSEISSYWDFQLRLSSLYKWLNEEWVNKEQLLKSFSYLETKEFKDYTEKLSGSKKRRIKKDLAIVKQIKILINNYDSLENEEDKKDTRYDMIAKLQKILLLDNWSWDNVVWKIIWASLLNDKINLHFQKLNWILQASWEKMSDIYNDKKKMESYEKITILINNLWEWKVVYWLAENYLIRIIDTIWKKLWKQYSYPELEKTSMLWQFVYWKNTFINNLSIYKNIVLEMKKDLDKVYDSKNKEHILMKSMLSEVDIVISSFFDENNKKYTTEKIYDLFKNTKIKIPLLLLNDWKDANLNNSILPLESEFSWIDFRNTFFRYINTIDLKREWPWFMSRLIPLIR